MNSSIGALRADLITETINRIGSEKFVAQEGPLNLNTPLLANELENEGMAHMLRAQWWYTPIKVILDV